MTIKSQGGVFGRNPTFNDVGVDGKLTGGNLRGDSLGIGVDSLTYGAEFAKAGAASYVMVNQTGASPSGLLIGAEGAKNSIYSGTGPGNLAGKSLAIYQGFTLVCTTTAAGNLAFPSGQGIDFSATAGTGTSELFDDYEEGAWTPVLVGGTTAGAGTYSQQDGVYTKVGNLVTVSCYLAWNAHTGTGTMTVTGLPFSGVGSSIDVQPGATYAQRVDAGTNATQMIARIAGTGSSILLHGFVNDSLKTDTQVNSDGSGSQLGITITYRTT